MGTVLGENLRALRKERRQTQVEAARFLAEHGLRWTRDHLNNVELGRRPVIELNVLWLLSWAYDVPLARWFEGDGEVWLSPSVSTTRERIRAVLPHVPAPLTTHGDVVEAITARLRGDPEPHEADRAVADRLGVPVAAVLATARGLWGGRTVTEERDQRLGEVADLTPRSIQARRGALTRQLTAEIRPFLEASDGTDAT